MAMKLDILISDRRHPLWPVVNAWAARHPEHQVRLLQRLAEAGSGDYLVMVACQEIAKPELRDRYRRCFVTHASDLPEGRGWSPAVWDVLQGRERLVLALIEAAEPVDSGRIFGKFQAPVRPTDLHDDISRVVGELVVQALEFILQNPNTQPTPQSGQPTWHRKRIPEDSRLDPAQSIASQFNLLRVCDPERYPAFFELHGERFELIVRKSSRMPSP
jgi:methionyl-tRNA formyltransferase